MARKKAAKKPAKKKKAPARKKRAKRKAATRRAAAKRVKAKVKKANKNPITKKLTKSGILNELAMGADLTRKQVATLIDELEGLISRHIKKGAVGEFTLPGLLKVRAVKRPATKKRLGRNPATGQEIMIAAKPASIRVRVTALKRLKGMVG
jgi:nucleoid DNA-binding protein